MFNCVINCIGRLSEDVNRISDNYQLCRKLAKEKNEAVINSSQKENLEK